MMTSSRHVLAGAKARCDDDDEKRTYKTNKVFVHLKIKLAVPLEDR